MKKTVDERFKNKLHGNPKAVACSRYTFDTMSKIIELGPELSTSEYQYYIVELYKRLRDALNKMTDEKIDKLETPTKEDVENIYFAGVSSGAFSFTAQFMKNMIAESLDWTTNDHSNQMNSFMVLQTYKTYINITWYAISAGFAFGDDEGNAIIDLINEFTAKISAVITQIENKTYDFEKAQAEISKKIQEETGRNLCNAAGVNEQTLRRYLKALTRARETGQGLDEIMDEMELDNSPEDVLIGMDQMTKKMEALFESLDDEKEQKH